MGKTCRGYSNLAQKFCQEYSSIINCTRGESGKETLWSHWRIGGDGRRWVVRSQYSQSQLEQSKLPEEIDVRDHPPQSGIVRNEERNKKFFGENQTDSLLHPHIKRIQHEMMLVYHRRLHLSPSCGTPSQTVHTERRILSYSTEVYRRYQNNTYVTGCIVGKTCWRLLERKWRSRIVRNIDKFQKICCCKKWNATDIHGRSEGGVTDEETNDVKTRQCLVRYVEANVWCIKRETKRKWTIEKPKFDNARKLRGFFFIEPEDEDFKNIMKNVRRKLEIPVLAAMPCKTPINSGGETCCGIGKHRTKYACVVEADESKRIRLEGAPWRYHEDHIAAKGTY